MKTLQATQKITLATLKSFAKRNAENLFTKEESCFDGMVDGVVSINGSFEKTRMTEKTGYYRTGIQGIYTVGSSRDYFNLYEDENYIGIKVYNSCGSSILVTKKQ